MKRKLHAGTTSESVPIFVFDSSQIDGSGLGSLAFNTSGLAGEYRRKGQSSWTPITLVPGTLGAYAAGGWAADGALAGAYEVGIPDAALAAGADWVLVRYYGAANMVAVQFEIELDAVNYQSATGFVASVPAVVGDVGGNVVGAVGSVLGAVGSVAGSVGGSVAGSVGSVAGNVVGSVGSVVGSVGSVTGNVGGSVLGSAGSVTGVFTLDLTQPLDTSNTGDTVGGALLAARAQGFGKWVFSGNTLTLYAADSRKVVRSFQVDNPVNPTQRF